MSSNPIDTNSVSLISQLWLPFLATAGASLTVLAVQCLSTYRKEQRQRIYAISYMADVLYRLVYAELILQKHTIEPHIEATKRMLCGDRELLEQTLDADEFDILAAGPMSFTQLSANQKLLVGYNDIRIVQAFDSLLYLHTDDSNRVALRSFVAKNLKSKRMFLAMPHEQQNDVLNTYWDYLSSLKHEEKRIAAFAVYIFGPLLREYAASRRFILFSTKPAVETLDRISALESEFEDYIPAQEFFEQSRDGGIQGML